jgi:hypothetical protein
MPPASCSLVALKNRQRDIVTIKSVFSMCSFAFCSNWQCPCQQYQPSKPLISTSVLCGELHIPRQYVLSINDWYTEILWKLMVGNGKIKPYNIENLLLSSGNSYIFTFFITCGITILSRSKNNNKIAHVENVSLINKHNISPTTFRFKWSLVKQILYKTYCLSIADPVAVRSKAWVFGRSLARIVVSNPTYGVDVCLLLVLCVVR